MILQWPNFISTFPPLLSQRSDAKPRQEEWRRRRGTHNWQKTQGSAENRLELTSFPELPGRITPIDKRGINMTSRNEEPECSVCIYFDTLYGQCHRRAPKMTPEKEGQVDGSNDLNDRRQSRKLSLRRPDKRLWRGKVQNGPALRRRTNAKICALAKPAVIRPVGSRRAYRRVVDAGHTSLA